MAKTKPRRDEVREDRIRMEIVVDAYNERERTIGWYCYLENQIQFPFTATCIGRRAISPMQVNDEVEVIGMADQSECEHEMFVTIRWGKDGLAVPLNQVMPTKDMDPTTKEAVADWHYWVGMGV